ncbi:MAG: hypothetical protein KF696_15560 [Planctomycetes bacterium]|nr:hypothetical protein [Planctomycetota bacterium]
MAGSFTCPIGFNFEGSFGSLPVPGLAAGALLGCAEGAGFPAWACGLAPGAGAGAASRFADWAERGGAAAMRTVLGAAITGASSPAPGTLMTCAHCLHANFLPAWLSAIEYGRLQCGQLNWMGMVAPRVLRRLLNYQPELQQRS